MYVIYAFWFFTTFAQCLVLEDELLYCPDSFKINFSEKCETRECAQHKNKILSYINHQDFYFRIGKHYYTFFFK